MSYFESYLEVISRGKSRTLSRKKTFFMEGNSYSSSGRPEGVLEIGRGSGTGLI